MSIFAFLHGMMHDVWKWRIPRSMACWCLAKLLFYQELLLINIFINIYWWITFNNISWIIFLIIFVLCICCHFWCYWCKILHPLNCKSANFFVFSLFSFQILWNFWLEKLTDHVYIFTFLLDLFFLEFRERANLAHLF